MEKKQGKIITFYSYKGGTGRSMALANLAWILASSGKQVLVVDWDLEAPGLHRYFAPFLDDKELTTTDGLIDMVSEYALATVTQQQNAEGAAPAEQDAEWYKSYADILNYAVSLNWEFPGKGTLDLLIAGRQGDSYSARVNSFNWQDFYDRRGGGIFLKAVKEKMQEEYDFILIDSRTGVSDTAGICTVQMPDLVIVCFTLNNQGSRGTAAVARSIYEQRLKINEPVEIFPVPMRVEPFEKNKLDLRLTSAKQLFNVFPAYLSPNQRAQFQDHVQVQYLPYYAYEEILAAFGNKPGEAPARSLLYPAERLAEYVTGFLTPDDKITRMEANEALERQRALILARFEGKEVELEPDTPDYLLRVGEAAFANLSPEEQEVAKRAILQMIRYTRPDDNEPNARLTLKLTQFDDPSQQVLRKLANCPLLARDSESNSAQETIGLASDVILRDWLRLQEWITADFDFLLWRQQLRNKMAEWEKQEGALLTGTPLDSALRYAEHRTADLNERELHYIQASKQEADHKLAHYSSLENQLQSEREQKSNLEEKQTILLQSRRSGLTIVAAIILLGLAIIVVLAYVSYQNKQALAIQTAESERQKAALAQASSLTIEGIELGKQGDFATAMSKFEEAIQRKPDYAEAYFQKANTYLNNRDFELAIGTYTQTLELKPDFVEALVKRGTAKLSTNDFDGAINDFSEVIKNFPQDKTMTTEAYRSRGEAQQQKNNFDAAITDYNQAITLMPDMAESYLKRGTAYKAKGDKAQASASYQMALDVAAKTNNETTRASAQAGLKQLGVKVVATLDPVTSPTPAIAPTTPKIYLQYQDVKDEKVLDAIIRALATRQFITPRKQKVTQPTEGDVRYFYEEDRAAALQVKQITERTLQQQRIEQSLKLRFLGGLAGKASRGQIEVWLPPLPEIPRPNPSQQLYKDSPKSAKPLSKSKQY